MVRTAGLGGALYLLAYVVVSLATGQQVAWLGDGAQMVPPIAYAALTLALARRCRGQARVFWNLNALHAVIWAAGQAVWTYYDLVHGAVPTVSPTDPIFFTSGVPLAAALYNRPDRTRPRWLFEIVLLDLVLIGLFAAFVYIYFVVSVGVTGGNTDIYSNNFTQLLNARSLLLAVWAGGVGRTARGRGWQRVLGIYAGGLVLVLAGGLAFDAVEAAGQYAPGALFDVAWMAPYVVFSLAAAVAWDEQLVEPDEGVIPIASLPMASLIAIALLVAIPAINELSRRMLDVPDATEALRTRLALAMMIPLGVVVAVREYLSRKALIRAGQDLVSTREMLVQKEKLAAVGQLVSGVAHELNNPQQGVLGYAELMLAARPPANETEELRAIRDTANRAAGIVRNLLTFAGRSSSTRSWQQMNRIVRDAVAVREPHLMASGIDLRVDAAERLPLVYVDHARLEDVIVNLIQNAEAAIAARREGGPQRSAVPPRARGEIVVTTRWQADPERILVDVADNGSGLKDEDLTRVFDPFFTTREVGQGTGLGLSVCYGIVHEHGGQITARNRDTGGAVFTIELPVMAESLASAEAAMAAAEPRPAPAGQTFVTVPPADLDLQEPAHRRKALVVDDEESNAALVRRVLAGSGYDVESTTLSRRALVMMERTAYDCVICDVKMPELGGQELYGRVCQIRPEMARRFIFITGDIDGQDTREFLDQSRCSYFMKPFNLERLTAAVDMLTGAKPPDTIG